MLYDGEMYWQITETSAVRHHQGKLKVLNVHRDGEVTVRIRSIQDPIYRVVEGNIKRSETNASSGSSIKQIQR